MRDLERAVVDAVLAFYGPMKAWQLRALTHTEGPWTTARLGIPDGAPSTVEIPISQIRRYYTGRSIAGDPAPVKPPIAVEPPLEETLRLTDAAIDRWREALDKLAR